MPYVTPAMIARMRAQRRETLPDICELRAIAQHGDDHDWPATTATVPCTVIDQPDAVPNAIGIYETTEEGRYKTIVLAGGTLVEPGWRLVWKGTTFEVREVQR